jgi:hypothetical protein
MAIAGIYRNGGPVAAHRHTAHHLDPACDIGAACTALDLIGRKVDGLHAAGTESD